MFRHFITGINIKKIIEMQSKQEQKSTVYRQVQKTSNQKGKQKTFTRQTHK